MLKRIVSGMLYLLWDRTILMHQQITEKDSNDILIKMSIIHL